ncbi:MAG TPA: flagellar motor protein MotB [Rhizomicrobium sp.]|jgi:chemotaxis protein MotB|nr:flagellar motor protein MotB [Rhizomicrobium sp.]
MAGDNAVIVKRVKKDGHGGHHGGAWKVAYADFVTAMMAFFLLMWLINTTTPEQKRGIADYFAPQSIAQTVSGSGGVLGGQVMGRESSRAGGAASVFERNSPSSPDTRTKSTTAAVSQGGASRSDGESSDGQSGSGDSADRASASSEDGDFARAAEAIHQAVSDNPDIAQLSKQVIVDQTPEGMRIQLVDQDGRPMFQRGTSEPMPYTRRLLAEIGKIIDRLPNRVSISGHTEATPFSGSGGITNWELSAARANAGRALLAAGGLSGDRIYEVAGKAGSEPLLPEDPNASANRRLSITLLREAPPTPPGHQL